MKYGNRPLAEYDVVIYHDETLLGDRGLRGHILFFVPLSYTLSYCEDGVLFKSPPVTIRSHLLLCEEISKIRRRYRFNRKMHFTDVGGKKWHNDDRAFLEIINAAVEALRCHGSAIFRQPLCCKFAIIYYGCGDLSYYNGSIAEKKLRYAETVLRMLLKGAIHYLYDELNQVNILNIFTDGFPHHRELDETRVIAKLHHTNASLISPLESYCNLPIEIEIAHQISDHKEFDEGTDNWSHANMLQLADAILGACNYVCIKGRKPFAGIPHIDALISDKKHLLAGPVATLLEKRERGRNYTNSGHFKSFAISRAIIKDGSWCFETADAIDQLAESLQLRALNV